MSELEKLNAYRKKLQGICDENELVFRFRCDEYPISLTIRPVSGVAEQMDLLSQMDGANVTSPDASLVFMFSDGVISYRTTETFTIGETLFNKLKNLFKNLHYYWLQFFFREIVENNLLSRSRMPVITDEDEGTDAEDGDSPAASMVRTAILLVRSENKADIPFLMEQFGIDREEAGRLVDKLVELGVVGHSDGDHPGEVLPYDEPDDEPEGDDENEESVEAPE